MLSELAPLLSQQLPLTPIFELTVYPDRQVLAEVMNSHSPTLCFLDVSTHRNTSFALIANLLSLKPGLQIIVLLSANEPDLILGCLRQGAAEFLLDPFTGDQMRPVLERLSQLGPSGAAASRNGARIYCVMPVKGACGASTIATNLSFQWKRTGAKRILLADMDPMTGTISFLLKLKSTYSFMDALSRGDILDSDLWKGMITSTQGVDVLLSPDNPLDGIHDLPDPGPVIDFCRQAYDTVTIDAGGTFGQWSLALASHCDEVLLVTTNELPALRATQRALLNFDKNRLDRGKIRLIVNRFDSSVGLSQEAIETALHNDVYHLLPSDYETVQKALVEGRPISPSSAFGKNLVALADRLSGNRLDAPPKKKSSWTSLISSLVSRAST
ncbi:MAG: hypothetical protein ACRD44_16105 [Bryobacteraceae bacterium]